MPRCPACKHKFQPAWNYCRHCGRTFDEAKRFDLIVSVSVWFSSLILAAVALTLLLHR